MDVLPLGLLPLTVLWTLVCLGLGAWTMLAVRRIRASPFADPPLEPVATSADPHQMDLRKRSYDAALLEALRDGVIGQEESARLYVLRQAWDLSPADHVHAVARARGDDGSLGQGVTRLI